MTAALKLRVQKDVYDPLRHVGTDHPGAHGQHIGVVVAAGELGGEGIAAQGAADAVDLVGGDGDADAGGADDDAPVTAAVGHRLGGRLAEDGVVAALLTVTAAVQDVEALGGEIGLDMLLEAVAAVVRRNGNHSLLLLCPVSAGTIL